MKNAYKLTLMSIFALVACLFCSNCSGDKGRSKAKNALVGKWEDQVKLIGGQGVADFRILLKENSTFTMDVEVGERAHALIPYPTLDRIQLQGNWSVENDGGVILYGKIHEFTRLIKTGQAASQGFLHDEKAEIVETHYTPLPLEKPIVLSKSENGTLFLSIIQFQGNEPGSESSYPTTRMITAVSLKK